MIFEPPHSFLGQIHQRMGAGIICSLALLLMTTQPLQALAEFASAQEEMVTCGLSAAPSGRIRAIDNLGLVHLEDGRTMRLSGIWLASDGLSAKLSSYINRTVVPYPSTKRPDRTGAVAAHFVLLPKKAQKTGEKQWLQAEFLSLGIAFLYIYPDRESCAHGLRRFETEAKIMGKGIWSQVLPEDIAKGTQEQNVAIIVGEAENLTIESAEGRYGIISGRVVSTGKSGRWRYLNFGNNFSRDFTVRITARAEKRLSEQGLTIKGLEEKRVEVRGVIQSLDGPMIDVFDAAQIVVME